QMIPKGSGLQHIHLEDLRRDCIPLPPLNEQRRIVAEAQRHLSGIEALSDALTLTMKRADRLRSTILKNAFTGKLVPQDPVDESAFVLLERIRQSREAAIDSRPRRGRGIKPGVSTPGPATPTDPKPRRGAGNHPESASAPSGLRDGSEGGSLGLKPQALCPGPVGAQKAVAGE